MAFSRYDDDDLVEDGRLLATNTTIVRIRDAIRTGAVKTTTSVLTENQRLDIIAGNVYGDGRLWWIIAMASGIGWWLQAPAGTRLVIPTDLTEIEDLL